MHKVRNLDHEKATVASNEAGASAASPGAVASGAPAVSIFAYGRCGGDGVIIRANGTFATWVGVDDPTQLEGQRLAAVMKDDMLAERWLSLTAPGVETIGLGVARPRPMTVRAEIRPAEAGGIDIFMVQEPGEELIARVARLEATLTLTAGTVHDVNNVLTVLAGNLFLLTESVRSDETLLSQARRARNAAERGSTLLRELLTFNRDIDYATKAISPGNHALALRPLLERAIGPDHKLDVTVDRKSGSVLASAAQLESVLINLVINARDALHSHGCVRVEVKDSFVDRDRAMELRVAPGNYVCVRVIDDGAGIPAALLHRVTEPLFSTKPRDHGSGLGLAMVRYFTEQAQGALQIESQEGSGTCVTVWLPRTEQLAETTVNMTLPLSTLPAGDERLLLISRDRDVQVAMQQILETLGYAVAVGESLQNIDEAPAGVPPDVIISERTGAALQAERRRIEMLKEANPALKHIALLQAGTEPSVEAPDADGHVYRPVTVVELARTVRDVLEEKQ